MTPAHSEVLIVGAGPAGCAAAYDLAAAGVAVRLVDKAAFPRQKPCAGGLTARAIKLLRYPVTPVIERVAHDWVLGLGLDHATLFRNPFHERGPIAAMTVRARLDAFCLDKTREAGAVFDQVARITSLRRSPDGWRLETHDATFTSRFLIGADGANGPTSRLVSELDEGRDDPRPSAYAVAAEARIPVPDPSAYEMEMRLDVVGGGYAWIFPKRDHLNVGIYARAPTPGLKRAVVEFVRARLGIAVEAREVFGWRVPLAGHRRAHIAGGALFVGDAAALAEPLFGEGIHHAIASGQAAARSILEQIAGRPDPYARLRAPLDADLRGWSRIAARLDARPEQTYRLVCLAPSRYTIMRSTALGWSLGETLRRLPLLPFVRAPKLFADPP